MKPVRPFLLLLALAGWASVISTPAASGTWTNGNGGSWTNTANWGAATIADGSGNTANFTTLNLPSDVTVTLDGPHTIGNLNFDDQNATKHNWFLQAGSGGALTLAGPSGSGKSTVLRCLNRLVEPSSGYGAIRRARHPIVGSP